LQDFKQLCFWIGYSSRLISQRKILRLGYKFQMCCHVRAFHQRKMPAVQADDDWDMWLRGTPDEAKACLKTVEGVRWTMTKEEMAATMKRKKAAVSDPTGLF
jgi:hypothetical protein